MLPLRHDFLNLEALGPEARTDVSLELLQRLREAKLKPR